MFLSKFGIGIFDKTYNSSFDKNVFKNLMQNKAERFLNSEKKNSSKLKVLSEIFDVKNN